MTTKRFAVVIGACPHQFHEDMRERARSRGTIITEACVNFMQIIEILVQLQKSTVEEMRQQLEGVFAGSDGHSEFIIKVEPKEGEAHAETMRIQAAE